VCCAGAGCATCCVTSHTKTRPFLSRFGRKRQPTTASSNSSDASRVHALPSPLKLPARTWMLAFEMLGSWPAKACEDASTERKSSPRRRRVTKRLDVALGAPPADRPVYTYRQVLPQAPSPVMRQHWSFACHASEWREMGEGCSREWAWDSRIATAGVQQQRFRCTALACQRIREKSQDAGQSPLWPGAPLTRWTDSIMCVQSRWSPVHV